MQIRAGPTDGRAGRPISALRRADETRELALLTQFMRHDSVASLASAIAERLGGAMRGGDLIAAAGLGASRDRQLTPPAASGTARSLTRPQDFGAKVGASGWARRSLRAEPRRSLP